MFNKVIEMRADAQQLRERVEKMTDELKVSQHALETLVANCPHLYTPAVYDPIVREGYTDPGDPPGTMGVDRRLPCYIPEETIRRWKRECTLCGNVEYTTRTTQNITEQPRW
jgi:hypothetical protein